MGVRKVYVPKWQMWLGLAFLVAMWLVVTYAAHVAGDGSEMGVGAWLLITLVMAVLAVLLILMGSRKLPAYLVNMEEEDAE